MRNTTDNPRVFRAGFTLTELLVVVAVGGILSGVLVADLSQTRAKLLQQACAANLKQWGMAISMYTQDYNGTYFYSCCYGLNFDDTTGTGGTITNPYAKYFGGGDPAATIHKMRICPYVAATMPDNTSVHTYSMPIATVRTKIGGYGPPTEPSPYVSTDAYGSVDYWFTLRPVPNPSQYLLLMDTSGHTLTCGAGNLKNAVNGIPTGDTIRAIDRHPGGVNCLFGDFHVECVTYSNIVAQDAINCSTGNPWFMMN